jgi:hypothetical protein
MGVLFTPKSLLNATENFCLCEDPSTGTPIPSIVPFFDSSAQQQQQQQQQPKLFTTKACFENNVSLLDGSSGGRSYVMPLPYDVTRRGENYSYVNENPDGPWYASGRTGRVEADRFGKIDCSGVDLYKLEYLD